MTKKKKIYTPDASHQFVQKVKQYRDECYLDREFERRQKVFAAREYGFTTQESISARGHGGGRPNMTPAETRILVDKIITGETVPDPMQIHSLAVQFGLVGEQITELLDLGGAYLKHCDGTAQHMRHSTSLLRSNETLHDIVRDILAHSRLSNRTFGSVTIGHNERKIRQVLRPHHTEYGNINQSVSPTKFAMHGREIVEKQELRNWLLRCNSKDMDLGILEDFMTAFDCTEIERLRLYNAFERGRSQEVGWAL